MGLVTVYLWATSFQEFVMGLFKDGGSLSLQNSLKIRRKFSLIYLEIKSAIVGITTIKKLGLKGPAN